MKPIVLSVFLFNLFNFCNLTYAQQNPPWAKDFVGKVRFQLTDDRKLRNLKSEWKQAQDAFLLVDQDLQREEKKLLSFQEKVTKITESIRLNGQTLRKNKQQIDQLASQILDAQTEIDQLTKEVTAQTDKVNKKQAQIAVLQEKINLKLKDEGKVKEDLALNEKNLEVKNAELKKLLDACMATGATKQECMKKPEIVPTQKEVRKLINTKTQLKTKLAKITEDLNKLKTEKAPLDDQLTKLNTRLTTLTQKLATKEKRIAEQKIKRKKLKESLDKIKAEQDQLKKQQTGLEQKIVTQKPLVQKLKKSWIILERKSIATEDSFRNYRVKLIDMILNANQSGVNQSIMHASIEGIEIAKSQGRRFGMNDGRFEGLKDGEAAGRRRDFDRGIKEGEYQGRADGQRDGNSNGKADGLKKAYAEVGENEGRQAGIARANKSDATSVGKKLGERDGTSRAQRQGKEIGYQRAENEVIQKFENAPLSKKSAQGPYAVQYQRTIPPFPGASRKYYNPTSDYRRQVVIMAYGEGYDIVYNQEVRRMYQREVGAFYDEAFKRAYDAAYEQAYKLDYPDSFKKGKDQAYPGSYQAAYDQAYKTSKEDFYRKGLNNPDRSDSNYVNAYNQYEKIAYQNQYQYLKDLAYKEQEQKTYDQLINGQIAKYKSERLASAIKVYQRHPILKIVKVDSVDAGINKVAHKDGIFQPGESISYSVTLKNFGETKTTQARLLVNNAVFDLGVVPAKSEITIEGIGQFKISSSARLNQLISNTAVVEYKGMINDHLISRHYNSNGKITSKKFDYLVKYPFEFSALNLATPVILNQAKNLSLAVKNASRKSYTGEIKIKTSASLGNQLVHQEFKSLNGLSGVQNLKDAQIKVTDLKDVLSTFDLKIEVSKKGVLLGQITSPSFIIKKANQLEKGKVILAINSDQTTDRNRAKSIMESEGYNKYMLYDTSLDANISTIKDIKKSKILFVSKLNSDKEKILEVLKEQENNLFFFLKDGHNTLASSVMSLKKFQLASQLKLSQFPYQIISTGAPLSYKWIRLKAIDINKTSDLNDSLWNLELMSDAELKQELVKKLDKKKVLKNDASLRPLITSYLLRAMQDVYSLNRAYQVSNTFLKKADLPEFLIKDFENSLEKASNDEKKSMVLLYEILRHNIFSDRADAIIGWDGTVEKKLKKMLKLNSTARKIYKKIVKDKKFGKKIDKIKDQFIPYL